MGCTFLVTQNQLRFIASAAINKSGLSDQSLFVGNTPLAVHTFSSLFCNHGRPTCHFVENFLVLDFSYSFDWSQAAFGAFSFFFFSTTWETPEIYFHTLFILYAISVRENTQWSESWESIAECNSLATSSRKSQIEDYFFNEKFYLETLNPKKTQWKHLLYISNGIFIDESSWNPCSLRAKVSVLLRSGLFDFIYGLMVTSSDTFYISCVM